MNKLKTKVKKIQNLLKKSYPEVKTQLKHNSPFELLVATILSAQCTDKQVNQATTKLFKQLKTPDDFAGAPNKTIEELIRSTGFFRNKAKNIKKCAQKLLKDHGGIVPRSLDQLVKLPGVGRKTANVVLGAAFGIPGVVVDTHVSRISQRLGLTQNKDPVKIEFDLMKIIAKKDWNDFCLQLIFFGREICNARKPKCAMCMFYDLCIYHEKQKKVKS